MAHIKPNFEISGKIKVVGIGGSGENAIDHMIRSKVKGVEFISINSDAQDLHHGLAPNKIQIGKQLTKGLGAGMNPDIGRAAAEEDAQEIEESLKGADMIFIAGGFGGGTFSGASPTVAQIAKNKIGALTVAVATLPFNFEGAERARIAEEWLARLKEEVDSVIVIPNDRLFSVIDKETTFLNAFAICDEVLRQAVQGISDLITIPGIINIDFADIRTILKDSGPALMGIGLAQGEKRAEEAAQLAINSPLLDLSINGARSVLFAVAGGPDLTMWEIQEAARIITESADRQAKVIFGALQDPGLKKDEIKITVIATNFPKKQDSLNLPLDLGEDKLKQKSISANDKTTEEDWESVPAFLRRAKKV